MDLPRRVALYARASTDDQDYHLSVETQFIILREHAMTLGADVHDVHDVHEEYADTGPASGDRPGLQLDFTHFKRRKRERLQLNGTG